MTRFPSEIYQVCATYDGEAANYLDFTGDYNEALSHFMSAAYERRSPRVLCITFDLDTNMPETVSDVTDEFETATLIAAE